MAALAPLTWGWLCQEGRRRVPQQTSVAGHHLCLDVSSHGISTASVRILGRDSWPWKRLQHILCQLPGGKSQVSAEEEHATVT